MPRTRKHHPEVVTGSFGLHFEDIVKRNRSLVVAAVLFGIAVTAISIPIAVYRSLAGANYISYESEAGVFNNPALITKTADTSVSGKSYITFVSPACPSGQTGTYPNCKPQTCPSGTTGTYPNCTPISTGGIKPLTPGTSWQWQISGTLNKTILDGISNPKKMFDLDMENATAADISALKAKGIVVICYLETGSWENYRSDAGSFPDSVKGATLNGYPDERYLDIRSQTVKDLIVKRFDVAKSKGCDGIEPDIDDSYFENWSGNYNAIMKTTGFPLTYTDQVNYDKYMAAAVHARGMSMGLKNGADQKFVADMLPSIDWVLNEQCNQYNECGGYNQVIAANKAVFQVEYKLTAAQFCSKDNAANFDGLVKTTPLNATPRTACRNG